MLDEDWTYEERWKLFGTETAVVKGFFRKIPIFEDKFLFQNAYLRNERELEKVEVLL